MNAPPLPPRPTPDDAPPVVVGSLPPPSRSPVISIRVPSVSPGGVATDVPAPPGSQLVIPGALMPLARILAPHVVLVTIVVVVGVLVALRVVPTAALWSLFSLILGIQLPSIPIREAPTVLATVPAAPPPTDPATPPKG